MNWYDVTFVCLISRQISSVRAFCSIVCIWKTGLAVALVSSVGFVAGIGNASGQACYVMKRNTRLEWNKIISGEDG